MGFFDALMGPILGNIFGGAAGQAVTMGALFLITILTVVLLISRIPFEYVLIIVSPAIIVASFSGLLPPLAFGVVVLLLAFFFAGIVLVLAK